MTKRNQKIKTWMKNHHDAIVGGSAAAVLIGAYGAVVYLAIKEERNAKEHAKNVRDWTIAENAKGRSIFELADGNLMSVDSASLMH